MAGKGKFIFAGLLILAAVVYLIVTNTGSTAHYFLTIEELRAMGDRAIGRNLTVSGAVLGDSIVYDPTIPQVTFTIVQVPADPKEVERAGGWRPSSMPPSTTRMPPGWRSSTTT
jgi:cytochrome c-type biogenesis protein CcmE